MALTCAALWPYTIDITFEGVKEMDKEPYIKLFQNIGLEESEKDFIEKEVGDIGRGDFVARASLTQAVTSIYLAKQIGQSVKDMISSNERLAASNEKQAKALNRWTLLLVILTILLVIMTGVLLIRG